MARQLDDIEQAWRAASDGEVMTGLARPDDYPPEVYAIVQREADSRSLQKGDGRERIALRRPGVWSVAKKLAAVTQAHHCIAGSVSGAAVALCRLGIPESTIGAGRAAYLAVINVVCVLWLGFVCWPLRRYHVVLTVVLTWAVCYTATGVIVTWLKLEDAYQYRMIVYGGALVSGSIVNAVIPGAVLCLAVLLRNWYWPIHPPGHCRRCGYNLFGLTPGQCPECGEHFESEEIVHGEGQTGE